MKYYKLLKDLPTFNKGDIFRKADVGGLWHCTGPKGYVDVMAYAEKTLEAFPNILTDWFEEIKEPLINNKKVSKAVKAWAEANEIETAEYDDYWVSFRRDDKVISFKDDDHCLRLYGLEDNKTYTIDELCGEEDE